MQQPTESLRLFDAVGPNDPVPVITCIDLDSTGQLLAIGGDDHRVRLWDVRTKKMQATLQEHNDWVRGLAFSSDRSTLATIGQDGQIRLWNAANGSLVQTFQAPVRGSRCLEFEPNAELNAGRFAVCGFDSHVRIYDSTTGKLTTTLPTHGGNNRAIAYSPDGKLLAVAGRTGVVRVWNTSDNSHVADLKTDGRPINALAFSPDSSQIAFAGDGPFIALAKLDGTKAKQLSERPGKTFSLCFCSPDILASGESDNAIRLWNLTEGQETATLLGHTGTISTMIFEAKSNRLISGSFDTTVNFWNISGEKVSAPQADPFMTTPQLPPHNPRF